MQLIHRDVIGDGRTVDQRVLRTAVQREPNVDHSGIFHQLFELGQLIRWWAQVTNWNKLIFI